MCKTKQKGRPGLNILKTQFGGQPAQRSCVVTSSEVANSLANSVGPLTVKE